MCPRSYWSLPFSGICLHRGNCEWSAHSKRFTFHHRDILMGKSQIRAAGVSQRLISCASLFAEALARTPRPAIVVARPFCERAFGSGRDADEAVILQGVLAMSTDALSDVLSAVQLSGSVFFDVTAKSPWVAEAPPAARIAADVMPGAQHVIEYHVVTRGTCDIAGRRRRIRSG